MTTEQETQVLPVEDELPPPAPGRDGGEPGGEAPRLADGIDLIGRMEGSGYKDPPYLARRADGQVIQLPALLYVLAEQIDGRRDYAEIAERATEAFKRGISAENAQFLVDEKLRPLGVVAAAHGAEQELRKSDPLLALKF